MAFNPDALEGVEYVDITEDKIYDIQRRFRHLSDADLAVIINTLKEIVNAENIKLAFLQRSIFWLKLINILLPGSLAK